MSRPRLLDLFCGAGGAAVGYHRAGFDVVGVDIKPQPRYPFEFIQADALGYLAEMMDDREWWHLDAIHASPPCQSYSAMNRIGKVAHPDLIAAVRLQLGMTGLPWIIENVVGAPMRADLMLCGTMVGALVRRHRWFEANWALTPWTEPCTCGTQVRDGTLAGTRQGGRRPHGKGRDHYWGRERIGAAMGIDWMSNAELRQAIPPAYTEWIGQRLMEHLRADLAVRA